MQTDLARPASAATRDRRRHCMLTLILIIIVVLLLIGALPTWGYSTGWGYFPSGILAFILVLVLLLWLLGVL
jgi:hypothetical protein